MDHYDSFTLLTLVLQVVDDAVEHTKTGEHITIGMVVIRGNSIVILEPKERI
jgi:small nuclear ribonucleoprotein (snRNP)-like protein